MYMSHNSVRPSAPVPGSYVHPSQPLSTTGYHYANPPIVHHEGSGIAPPNMYATQPGVVHPYLPPMVSNHPNVQITHMGHFAPPAIPMGQLGGYSTARAGGFSQHSLVHPSLTSFAAAYGQPPQAIASGMLPHSTNNRMVPHRPIGFAPPHFHERSGASQVPHRPLGFASPDFHERNGASQGANTGQPLSYSLPTGHPRTFQPNVNPPHAANVRSAMHPPPPTATNPRQQMLESRLADVSAFDPTPSNVLSQTPSVRPPFRGRQWDREYETSSFSLHSRHTPVSHLSPFRTPSRSASWHSRGSTPYERPPNLPAPIPTVAAVTNPVPVPGPATGTADRQAFVNRVADELALLTITVGPAISSDEEKASLYQDAFRSATNRVPKPSAVFDAYSPS